MTDYEMEKKVQCANMLKCGLRVETAADAKRAAMIAHSLGLKVKVKVVGKARR